ncbi:MAG: cytochrome c biogenesis protein CcdA [Proteobacteria bacterium]|nr:cytochrome c biogenesis protein CcdA [Pseudomonadota bacterium]MBU4471194.1 cytochrome c biogenesis protein CcdA [Pseudomonadota bacterium]MCG2753169.1 cytochrome c biogenesis protein CcdA [Desulfobacteraceae bacterium]
MLYAEITYNAAFFAGLLSFLSPCILPLIPAYFTLISGFSLDELISNNSKQLRYKVFASTLFFVLGFSLVFILLGASASLLGGTIQIFSGYIRIVGGVVIIIMGIHLTGLFRIRFLEVEKRIQLNRPLHMFGTLFVGMAFGAGWTPCIGPLLGSVLILAGNQDTIIQGVILLSVYALGLAVPFLLLAFFIQSLLSFVKKAVVFMRYLNYASGILLIILGIFLITNKLMWVSA